MARISGVDLPREKRVEIGLTYIYGIGRTSANRILAEAGVNPDTRVKDLTDDEVKKLAAVIADTQTVEGDSQRDRYEHQETAGDSHVHRERGRKRPGSAQLSRKTVANKKK